MSGFSQSLALSIYNATLSNSRTALQPAGGVYLALHTAEPNDSTASLTEANYAGYARLNIASVMTYTTTGVAPEISITATNNAQVSFNPCTSGTQTVTHWAIWSDATATTGSYVMYSGALTSARSVQAGDIVIVPTNGISITLA